MKKQIEFTAGAVLCLLYISFFHYIKQETIDNYLSQKIIENNRKP